MHCAVLAFTIFLAVLIGIVENDGEYTDDGRFTAMWVATVAGLDFSGANKSVSQMKRELDDIISLADRCRFDAVYFQVRPAGDAFYKSYIFPWSRWLSGTEGAPPDGEFDPLAYLCKIAGRRGIEVHAWINPYRLTTTAEADSVIAQRYPHLVMQADNGLKYLNPGNPESINLVVDGVKEILEGYPVAGIVFDDYFYPSGVTYDDSAEYKRFGAGAGLEDWRRGNTYALVSAVNAAVKGFEGKTFGVSPCGVWRNKSDDALGSSTRGLQSYSELYADTYKWVQDGIVDYIAPQIYWEHGHSLCDFEALTLWWAEAVRGTQVKLYICHAVYKLAPSGAWDSGEIAAQLKTSADTGAVSGSLFYRYANIRDNLGGIADYFEKTLKG